MILRSWPMTSRGPIVTRLGEDRNWLPTERFAGVAHMDALEYWADMDRDIDFTLDGYRVLRFPAFMVRFEPKHVACAIRKALGKA
jgi:hypothetical protein